MHKIRKENMYVGVKVSGEQYTKKRTNGKHEMRL